MGVVMRHRLLLLLVVVVALASGRAASAAALALRFLELESVHFFLEGNGGMLDLVEGLGHILVLALPGPDYSGVSFLASVWLVSGEYLYFFLFFGGIVDEAVPVLYDARSALDALAVPIGAPIMRHIDV